MALYAGFVGSFPLALPGAAILVVVLLALRLSAARLEAVTQGSVA